MLDNTKELVSRVRHVAPSLQAPIIQYEGEPLQLQQEARGYINKFTQRILANLCFVLDSLHLVTSDEVIAPIVRSSFENIGYIKLLKKNPKNVFYIRLKILENHKRLLETRKKYPDFFSDVLPFDIDKELEETKEDIGKLRQERRRTNKSIFSDAGMEIEFDFGYSLISANSHPNPSAKITKRFIVDVILGTSINLLEDYLEIKDTAKIISDLKVLRNSLKD